MINADNAKEFIESYYRPKSDMLESLRLQCEGSYIPVILRETEDMLSILLKLSEPSNILEIGTAAGYSALFFAELCPKAHITTIERSHEMIKEAERNIEKFGRHGSIDILEGDAGELLASGRFDKIYDFVFIDAAKTHYREYFDLCVDLCRPGAVVVCDNILIHGWIYDRSIPGAKRHRTNVKYMKSFLDYIKNRDDLTVSISGGGDGLAIIKLND